MPFSIPIRTISRAINEQPIPGRLLLLARPHLFAVG
jgi:hypothetical protein